MGLRVRSVRTIPQATKACPQDSVRTSMILSNAAGRIREGRFFRLRTGTTNRRIERCELSRSMAREKEASQAFPVRLLVDTAFYFFGAAFCLAHLARTASAILLRASGLMVRFAFAGLDASPFPAVLPSSGKNFPSTRLKCFLRFRRGHPCCQWL